MRFGVTDASFTVTAVCYLEAFTRLVEQKMNRVWPIWNIIIPVAGDE